MFSSNQSYIKPLCLIVCMSLMLMNASDAYEFCGTKSDFKWRRYPDTCNALYFCFLGKAVTFRCPPGQVVGADKRYCVPENSVFDDCTATQVHHYGRIMNVPITCKPGERFPSEESCAKFSECITSGITNATIAEKECPYPQLYDVTTQKCSPFANVKCELGVFEPKSPCDYTANQCGIGAHTGSCIPCNIRFPTCTGLPDGMNSWQGKEWSPHYVVCQQERITYSGMCKSGKESHVFHPDKRQCVKFDLVKTIVG